MTLTIENLSVTYGDVPALTNVNIKVEPGEICALMGRSGSGKSSLLRAAAGIVATTAGTISVGDRDVTNLAIHERRIGLMFQSYALCPHLNVADNVAFGIAKHPDRGPRVAELLALVDLTGFETRAVGDLSGGEQQRVALARTLAPSPEVMFLDEPLGSLDTALRQTLLTDITSILATMNIPVVYVTHDPAEAFAIADSITVLHRGVVNSEGPPRVLWTTPPTAVTARLLDRESVVEAATLPPVIRGDNTGTVLVPTEAVELLAVDPPKTWDAPADALEATVRHVVFAGLSSRATVQCADAMLTLDTTRDLTRNQKVYITVDAAAVTGLSA